MVRAALIQIAAWFAASVAGSSAAALALAAFGPDAAGPRGAELAGYILLMTLLGAILTAPASAVARLTLWGLGRSSAAAFAIAGALVPAAVIAGFVAGGSDPPPLTTLAAMAPFGALGGLVWRRVERGLARTAP